MQSKMRSSQQVRLGVLEIEIAVSQVNCDFGMNGATTTVNTYMGESADAASPLFESCVGKTVSGSR